MDNQTAPELLTPNEIASMLKITVRQFNERVSKRDGFPEPLNQKVMGRNSKRWKKDDIISWIKNGGQ